MAAHFEYDPFGNTVVNTDTSNLFTYRFSTKPVDFVTGLYYYGYRYYDPMTGRWPTRDPIGERGGVNLYGFVGNNGLNRWDVLGKASALPKAAYRPMREMDWMGNLTLIWHAFVEYSDGTTDSNIGPEDGYESKYTRYVDGKRTYAKDLYLGGDQSKPCKCGITNEEVTECVKKHFSCGVDKSNCGTQVKSAFTECCLKDPTPWNLFY